MKKEEKRIEIKNKNAIFSNINACIQVGEELKPLLGPFGGDLMFQDEEKNILVSNDGTEVLKHLKIEHPSALMFSEVKNNKIYIKISKSQEEIIGDGTKTLIILSSELLKNSKELIEKEIHPTIIIQVFF
jgi:chaperonin GroEL (HSP60 family)